MRRRHDVDSRVQRPIISAIVATRDRPELLRNALLSLAGQSLPSSMFEVVVVDDGSASDAAGVVAALGERLPMVYERQRQSGLASARNHGLFLASGDIVVFLDDDDVFDAAMLEEHLRTHRVYPETHVAVLGYTGLTEDIAADPLMHFVTDIEGHLFSYRSVAQDTVLDFTHFWGGRTSCKRTFLLDCGIFNPAFRFGCEDIELAFRLSAHGLGIVYNPRSISHMARAFTVADFCERLRRQGESNYRFSQLHRDQAVQAWTGVAEADAVWTEVAGRYDELISTASAVDRLARLKLDAGISLTDSDRRYLYQAYSAACRAAKTRGIIDAKATAP